WAVVAPPGYIYQLTFKAGSGGIARGRFLVISSDPANLFDRGFGNAVKSTILEEGFNTLAAHTEPTTISSHNTGIYFMLTPEMKTNWGLFLARVYEYGKQ